MSKQVIIYGGSRKESLFLCLSIARTLFLNIGRGALGDCLVQFFKSKDFVSRELCLLLISI